jgi:hypothetical protein
MLTRAYAACVARATSRYCSYCEGVSARLYRRDHWYQLAESRTSLPE